MAYNFSLSELFTLESIFSLFMLILLQGVLGFDNLLYISLESQRVPEEKQNYVRKVGIGVAILLRVGILFFLISVIGYFQNPIAKMDWAGIIHFNPTIHSLIVLAGGAFIIYTAIKEVWHIISMEEGAKINRPQKPVGQVILMIVIMNLVFSFDSILSAMALSHHFWVMTLAIVVGGILMIWLSERISNFLKKNRLYEVLGLFVLFLVGVMLLSEGGHLAELELFDNHITPMNKTTFYFILFILVAVDLVQSKYQKKLMSHKEE